MRVTVEREDIHPGDHPPVWLLTADGATPLGEFIDSVAGYAYPMPGASWAVVRAGEGRTAVPIATVARVWDRARFTDEADRLLRLDSLCDGAQELRLHLWCMPGTVPVSEADLRPPEIGRVEGFALRVLDAAVTVAGWFRRRG
ncbi:hypothetical protein ACFYNO_03370 [Kitasatospora sp. NPDC006697]|uniref:hypothetical protein n=1 Tax=Kitasatospora sp. NPDC006697 TaxID=3364020 RepID=UPI0036BC607D